MATKSVPLHHTSKEDNDAHNLLHKPHTDTESVATLYSPLIEDNDHAIVFRNGSTKTIVPPSAGNSIAKKQPYSLNSPSLIRSKNSKTLDTHNILSSGKTAVSTNAFTNGIKNISEISLFGLPGSYRVSSNQNYREMDLRTQNDVDKYNISSPGINNSDIYEEISFDSNGSLNLQLRLGNSNDGIFLDEIEDSPLSMVNNRNKVIYAEPSANLHEEKFLNDADETQENIVDVLKSVRNELLFKDENKNSYNTKIFGEDLNKKDYQMSDDDKVKNILSFEMGNKKNFISDKLKAMDETLYNLKKDLNNPSDYFRSYINSYFCSTTSENYFLLKESISVVKRSPWCLFEENFWANYEDDYVVVSKPVLEYPVEERSVKKINEDFENFLEKEDLDTSDQQYELHTMKRETMQ